MNTDVTSSDFGYISLTAVGIAGGAVLSWRRDLWAASLAATRRFSVTILLTPLNDPGVPWWLTNIYGLTDKGDKLEFLQELRATRAACAGPWLLCGDFNMIYRAADKNNSRLHRGEMRRFQGLLDDLELVEVHLSGRCFTWNNGRDVPTMERLDRAFESTDWFSQYPSHHLRGLSSDYSDHAPLLLVLNT
jgi:endonuclease/exonuclease/phosphatase family metal-dependent hydrolase